MKNAVQRRGAPACFEHLIRMLRRFLSSSTKILSLSSIRQNAFEAQPSFTCVIIGRPNVGKSTLFNRLIGKRYAIVHNTPGVTRDRHEANARLGDLYFSAIDTAGLEDKPFDTLEGKMLLQTGNALRTANLVLLVIDGRVGVTADDEFFARWTRKFSVPCILVANKVDHDNVVLNSTAMHSLGLGAAVCVSAEHGLGFSELYDALKPVSVWSMTVQSHVDEAPHDSTSAVPIRIAIVGRPNVGKSTLVNRIIDEERVLTGTAPGVTRTAVEVPFRCENRDLVLVDTAGLRPKHVIQHELEKLAAASSVKAAQKAAVVVLLLNATHGVDAPVSVSSVGRELLTHQELSIAALVEREGRAMVIACNKWDLVNDVQATLQHIRNRLNASFHQLRDVPIVPVSALNGVNIDRLVKTAIRVYDRWNVRITTGQLNSWLERYVALHKPPVRIRYLTQIKTRPPTFAVFCANRKDMTVHYMRHLVSAIRDEWGLQGVPLRLLLRSAANPFAERSKT
eukprot:TRINITY_DN12_c0_g1_i1.p1 TRINITY_DN12_c0_g1~~TRINITY_DN12_c0_g1_i1.p1  ORF type:complete len:509 (-),score=52.40 TRINITY_DN12_c0_g1_i1:974-2500(-)